MFSITGKLKIKQDIQQVTGTFRKREFVITDDSSQYPQHIQFQLVQDKCELLDPFQPGQEIRVSFNIRGREWNNPKTNETKYFNSLDAWRIENAEQGNSSLPPMPQEEPQGFELPDDDDNLPF